MSQHAHYGTLSIADLAAAARMAVFAQVLRGLQALGPNTPTRHAIYITFDPCGPGVEYPQQFLASAAKTVTVVLQHRYENLQVDWTVISVQLAFGGERHAVHIPFAEIISIADEEAGYRLVSPTARRSPDFASAFRFALATLMVFRFGSGASLEELEGRAVYSVLPAIISRISRGTTADATPADIMFDTDIVGVSLPASIAEIRQPLISFTLKPGDRSVRVRSNKFIIECEGVEREKWMMVPFLAVQRITIDGGSLVLPVFPGPVADAMPNADAAPLSPAWKGLELAALGTPMSPSRFPPGSPAELIWQAGKFCLSGYVGRHSVPGLQFPEDLREQVPLGPSTSLELFAFEQPEHNARAFRIGSRYGVAVYQGLILTLPSFMTALWTHPGVVSWIGDVSRLPLPEAIGPLPEGMEGLEIEKIANGDLEFASVDVERVMAGVHSRGQRTMKLVAALDPVRRMAWQQCMEDAARYIWLHEIGHVVWGHVDMLETSTGELGISEIDDACGDVFPPELGQFLEFQADRFAFDSVLNLRVGELERAFAAGRSGDPGRGNPAFVDQATIAILACVTSQLVLAASLRVKGREDVAGTHPPIWFRVVNMISQAQSRVGTLELAQAAGEASEVEAQLERDMHLAVSSVVATHPMLMDIFQHFSSDVDARSRDYVQAFEQSAPHWEAKVKPHFKFYRNEDGAAALRD